MNATEARADYGRAEIGADSVTVGATQNQLWAWSHRSGASWPCSYLDDLEWITATFDSTGLVALEQFPEYDQETGENEIPGDEFTAWSSDVLRDVLPADHPCYFVTVGQFR